MDDAHHRRVRTQHIRELVEQGVQRAVQQRLTGTAGEQHAQQRTQAVDGESGQPVGLAVDEFYLYLQVTEKGVRYLPDHQCFKRTCNGDKDKDKYNTDSNE